jgi:hypothetical protein
MTTDDFEKWVQKYKKLIPKGTSSGEHDRYGPIDEFSLVRELQREVDKLQRERSFLNPKGPIPTDEESRFRADLIDDKDALTAALIDRDIEQLEGLIHEIESTSRKFSDLGKKGAAESKHSRQEAARKRHVAWRELAEKKIDRNPFLSRWDIAGQIAENYIEQGTAKSYGQHTVYKVIKGMDCFKSK